MAATRPLVLVTTANQHRETGLRRTDALTGLNYSAALEAEGLLPVMAPSLLPETAAALAARADGILFSGGVDIDPAHYGRGPERGLGLVDPDRDRFELALYRAAVERGLPILGVCRGIQLVNVAEGGTLHQHLEHVPGTIQHTQANIDGPPFHEVRLAPESIAAQAAGAETITVNSFHHQAVDQTVPGLRVAGRSQDDLVEALERPGEPWLLAVQWHPEMHHKAYPDQRWPFRALAERLLAG
jgi:putative glutamine amidotransferase